MTAAEPKSQDRTRPPWRIVCALVTGVLVLLLFPAPFTGRVASTLFDLAHAPVFFALVIGSTWLLAGRRPTWRLALVVWGLGILVGGIGEALQHFSMREAGWRDGFANVIGATLGLFAVMWYAMSWKMRGAAIVVSLVALAASHAAPVTAVIDIVRQRRDFPMLSSLETETEMTRWFIENGTMTREKTNVTHGEWSLNWTLVPADFSAITLANFPQDWSEYTTFEFDVIMTDGGPFDLHLRIEDSAHRGEYTDRYNQTIAMERGKMTVRVPLADLREAPEGRVMKLDEIRKLELFAMDLDESRRVSLDRFVLKK